VRISADALKDFRRDVAPPPAPVEPILSAVEEARAIANDSDHDPVVGARKRRMLAILRRPATPEPRDAEVLALLAAAGALPLERREDLLMARQRLAAVGSLDDEPPAVRRLREQLGLAPGDGNAFAEALLGHATDLSAFSENWPVGYGGPFGLHSL
jgi:hypothetical protein